MLAYVLPYVTRRARFLEVWNSSATYKKIFYIKALRDCTKMGLKDAKDAIESAEFRPNTFDFHKLESLFLNARAEPDTDFAPLAAAFAEAEKKDSPFILAMRNIEQNWCVLGFPSLRSGVDAVTCNF